MNLFNRQSEQQIVVDASLLKDSESNAFSL